MPLLKLRPYGVAARAALVDAVDQARGGDPLAPVVVAVPSALAGVTLRRGIAAARGGLANVRFT